METRIVSSAFFVRLSAFSLSEVASGEVAHAAIASIAPKRVRKDQFRMSHRYRVFVTSVIRFVTFRMPREQISSENYLIIQKVIDAGFVRYTSDVIKT